MSFTEEAPACAACTQFYVKRWDDEWAKYCNDCAHERVAELEAREPLVQAIVDFHHEIMASVGRWSTAEKAQGGKRMAELLTALAEWKP